MILISDPRFHGVSYLIFVLVSMYYINIAEKLYLFFWDNNIYRYFSHFQDPLGTIYSTAGLQTVFEPS